MASCLDCFADDAKAGAGLAAFAMLLLLGVLVLSILLSFFKFAVGSRKRLIFNSINIGLAGLAILLGLSAAGVLASKGCYDCFSNEGSSAMAYGIVTGPYGVVFGIAAVAVASVKLANDLKANKRTAAKQGLTAPGDFDVFPDNSEVAPTTSGVAPATSGVTPTISGVATTTSGVAPTTPGVVPPPPPPPMYSDTSNIV